MENHKGLTIEIVRESDPINPREDSYNTGTMACWHGRYILGDIQPKESPSEHLFFLMEQRE